MDEHHHSTKGLGTRALLFAVVANVALSVFELIAGLISGSVALLADALHNTNDAAALVIAYAARLISRKRADQQFTFGYRRIELVGAMVQLTALIMVGIFLVAETVKRLNGEHEPLGAWMMGAAGVAIVVDLATVLFLARFARDSLNIKAAFLHNLTDRKSTRLNSSHYS